MWLITCKSDITQPLTGELGSNYVCYPADRPRWHKDTLAAQSWQTAALYKHNISDHRDRKKYSTHMRTHTHRAVHTHRQKRKLLDHVITTWWTVNRLTAPVSLQDGWKRLRSLDGKRDEGGAVSPSSWIMGFGVWKGNVSQAVGFQRYAASLTQQRVICGTCSSSLWQCYVAYEAYSPQCVWVGTASQWPLPWSYRHEKRKWRFVICFTRGVGMRWYLTILNEQRFYTVYKVTKKSPQDTVCCFLKVKIMIETMTCDLRTPIQSVFPWLNSTNFK